MGFDYGQFVARLQPDFGSKQARALADVFRDQVTKFDGFSIGQTGARFRSREDWMRDRPVHVKDFAVSYSGGDETTLLQTAIDGTPTGGVLDLGEGDIRFSQITISKAITIRGRHRAVTRLRATNATNNAILLTANAAVNFEDMEINATVVRTAGTFISVEPVSGEAAFVSFRRCGFVDGWNCIDFVSAGGFAIQDQCYFVNYLNRAIVVRNESEPDSGDSYIIGSTFDAGVNATIAIEQNSSGGLRITNNKFLRGTFQYLGSYDSGVSDPTSILVIANNSFEHASTAAIAFDSSDDTVFSKVLIENNQFTVAASASAISITDAGYDFIDSFTAMGNQIALGNSAVAFALTRATRTYIGPNSIIGDGTSEIAFQFGTNARATQIALQDVRDVTLFTSGAVPSGSTIEFEATVTTTDATPTPVGFMSIADESAVTYTTVVTAREDGTGNRASYHKAALVYRNGAGATVQGAVQDVRADVESAAGWDATIGVASNEVRTLVTGAAATTINWKTRGQLVGAP